MHRSLVEIGEKIKNTQGIRLRYFVSGDYIQGSNKIPLRLLVARLILLVNGSPREKGNADSILNMPVEGSKSIPLDLI